MTVHNKPEIDLRLVVDLLLLRNLSVSDEKTMHWNMISKLSSLDPTPSRVLLDLLPTVRDETLQTLVHHRKSDCLAPPDFRESGRELGEKARCLVCPVSNHLASNAGC